jgi:tetraacyldisaccharide 4'-kinase
VAGDFAGGAPQVHRGGRRGPALAERVWEGSDAAARLARLALLPAELVYRGAAGVHHGSYNAALRGVERAGTCVISVGNLTVGGAGKTPFSGWLVERLRVWGRRPAVLHGGYAADEPELHRLERPGVAVYVGRDRVASARRAVAAGADVLVLDDGFQHRRLGRELDIVLVSAEHWSATPRLLPRGRWREPPSALGRAGLIVVVRKTASVEDAAAVAAAVARHGSAPIASIRLAPSGWSVGGHASPAPAGGAVLVTGVADWGPVAAHAREAGAVLEEAVVFPDHHDFDAADVERLGRLAGPRPIVTTAKDHVKLRNFARTADAFVLGIAVKVERGEDLLDAAVDGVLAVDG